jgi:hypothetical protein
MHEAFHVVTITLGSMTVTGPAENVREMSHPADGTYGTAAAPG